MQKMAPSWLCVGWIVTSGLIPLAGPHPGAELEAARVYSVNRPVADFPEKEDLSTPEATYATLNRLTASGDQAFWRRLSVPRLAERIPKLTGKSPVRPEAAQEWLNSDILEVHLWEETNAMVIAQTPPCRGKSVMDLRRLSLVQGRWLNEGNDVVSSLDEARSLVRRRRAYDKAERMRHSRPPIPHLEEHLRPFVDFLRKEACDPRDLLLRALEKHRLVILGEVHNRPRYWAFNTALARSPAFPRVTGVIYLELPYDHQPLMDQFLAAPSYDPAPVIDILRDLFEFGWPDQPTLEFCQAIWEINQSLPQERRLRIVLVDMARPWKKIQKRADWAAYDVDRNALMARLIQQDLKDHPGDSRHALFIVGYMHVLKNISHPGGEPFKSAGWHLSQAMGATNIYVIFPHSPVLSNRGGVDGRLGLGRFETAFAALTNRPMAFPLEHGPFGELLFDASLDFTTADPYRAAFDAFLYLGPLEEEILSPLIPGFYTDEYAREVDRRCRLMNGRGLESNPSVGQMSGEALQRMRETWWGQPRAEWKALGPLEAWRYGSDWKNQLRRSKHRDALQEAAIIRREAERLIEAICKADYTKPQNWRAFPSPEVEYWVHTDAPGWTQWICLHFSTNPIVQVELGAVSLQSDGRPALPYKLLLQNGAILQGILPFEWQPNSGRWEAMEGLDWHLRKDKQNDTKNS